MEEVYKIVIGIFVLVIGFFAGNFLAKITSDELKKGQPWFKLIIIASLIGAVITLIFPDDVLFFSFLFFAIATSRSLKKKEKKKSFD